MTGRHSTPSFRNVFADREFRALWLADVQSLVGDQLARVALSVLTYATTGSAFLTAATYSLTFLPALFGTPLGVLADRLPRRQLLVCGDLSRAALLAVIAVPGLPLPAVMACLFTAVLIGAPWKAAESALVADVLAGERYVLGSGIRMATSQGAQLAGFALGGLVVAVIGVHVALLVDAGTFVVSAVVLVTALKPRPAPGLTSIEPRRWGTGMTIVLHDARLRTLLGYAWLASVFVVPEALAAPYAAGFGGGAVAVGLLLASAPAGMLVTSLLFVRVARPDVRSRAVPALAFMTGLPLVACAGSPGLVATMALWGTSGALMCYQIQVMTEFVTAAPAASRGQAIAFASSGVLAGQGLGLLLGGVLAGVTSPAAVIAAAGVVGSTLAALLSNAHRRSRLAARTGPRAEVRVSH